MFNTELYTRLKLVKLRTHKSDPTARGVATEVFYMSKGGNFGLQLTYKES